MNVVKTLHEMKITASWCWEISSEKLYLSDSFAAFFNCTPKELPNHFRSNTTFFTSSQLSDLKKALNSFIKDDLQQYFICQTSHQIKSKSGKITLLWQGEVTGRNQKNEPLLVSGSAQQLSELESSALGYRKQALLFQNLTKNLPESIFFKDLDSRFLAINEACAEKFGLDSPEEAIGKTDFDFFDAEHAQDAFNDEQQIIATETPIINKVEKEILEYQKNNPTEHYASTTKLPLYNEAGKVIGTFGITRDITSEEKAKTKLEHNTEIIEKLSKQVPGFFYMYHQISKMDACFPFAS